MPSGFNGKILRVDLTARQSSVEEVEEIVYRRYLGGGGLGCYFLLREVDPGIDAHDRVELRDSPVTGRRRHMNRLTRLKNCL